LYSKTQLLFNAIYHDVIDIGEEISINELTSLNLPLAVFKEDYFELLFANNILEVRNRNRFFEFVKCYINHYGIYYKDIKCATSLKIKGYLENTHLKNRHKYGIRSMSGMLAHSSLFNGVLPDKEDQKEYGIYRLWSIR
jgi:hypothetical protein